MVHSGPSKIVLARGPPAFDVAPLFLSRKIHERPGPGAKIETTYRVPQLLCVIYYWTDQRVVVVVVVAGLLFFMMRKVIVIIIKVYVCVV